MLPATRSGRRRLRDRRRPARDRRPRPRRQGGRRPRARRAGQTRRSPSRSNGRSHAVGRSPTPWPGGSPGSDRLRELDPKRFGGGEKRNERRRGDHFRRLARSGPEGPLGGTATLTWTDRADGRRRDLARAARRSRGGVPRFHPARGPGHPALANPPGTIASVEPLARPVGDLGGAGRPASRPRPSRGSPSSTPSPAQFFGGRDFGTGVLGRLEPRLAAGRRPAGPRDA